MYFLSDLYGKRVGMTDIVAVETVNTSYLHTVEREVLKAQKIITSHPQHSFPPFINVYLKRAGLLYCAW